MLTSTLILLFLALSASAHFKVEYPTWRGDSLTTDTASQWIFPCANISEATSLSNRTAWSPEGGSLKMEVHHPWALTYVNLGIGTNVSAFNISLVSGFNQTGNGTFCLSETGKENLKEGLRKAGKDAKSVEGMPASLQVIQIAATGASLYNCADITFNATAALLSSSDCQNSTNVGGVAIQNAGTSTTNPQSSPAANASTPTGAAGKMGASLGLGIAGGALAMLVGL
ncbi:hypothetical protein GQ43DRAFT_26398 [Delitschia confertaspora ATCC 74209]|uniref:Copper acquisition factor BIM1-like domain-containing protein n=1 Tax=Delitschia confertaspora ATCC 74209 TaxID=1513339 RepID=A0A9P4MW46_9PLEO|nr:hypothetical protein GQ43DRAFT_26398 [Delitschia confertaspora ATCC 74209]